MSHKRHYELVIDGDVYDVYCDTLPIGSWYVDITPRVTVKPQKSGPNYDGSPNSIRAALLYEAVHPSTLWGVWRFLYANNGVFVSGAVLIDRFGTAALERVRELRHAYGWPIEAKSPDGPGVWSYCLNVPRLRRYIPRQ